MPRTGRPLGRTPINERDALDVSRYLIAGYSNREIRELTGLGSGALIKRLGILARKYGTGNRARLAVLVARDLLAKQVPIPELQIMERINIRKGQREDGGGRRESIGEEELSKVADMVILGWTDAKIGVEMRITWANAMYRVRVLMDRYKARSRVQLAVLLYVSKLKEGSRWRENGAVSV